MELQAHAATPESLFMGGRTWHLSPLTIGDLAELQRWGAMREFELAKEYTRDLDSETRKGILHEAWTSCRKNLAAGLDSSALMATVANMDGFAQIVGLALRKRHPEVTPQQVREMLDAGVVEELGESLLLLITGGVENPT